MLSLSSESISRGKGQSAIASAAYRAGTKLECTYYGEVSDYTRKGGVVLAEIHLPKQAPERFKDREILGMRWNGSKETKESTAGTQL